MTQNPAVDLRHGRACVPRTFEDALPSLMWDLPRPKKPFYRRWWFTVPFFGLLFLAAGSGITYWLVSSEYESKARQFDYSRLTAMESASEMFEKLYESSPVVAQYVVPNGFNRRVLAQFNLREAFAFCQLRSAANAHFSIRRVAQKMYEEMALVHPLLTKYMKLHDETWKGVEEGHFAAV